MKRVYYLVACAWPFLGSCSALSKMAGTPADPANPEGPSQLDGVVNTGAAFVSTVNPLWGGVLAAAGLAGYGAWKAKQPPKA